MAATAVSAALVVVGRPRRRRAHCLGRSADAACLNGSAGRDARARARRGTPRRDGPDCAARAHRRTARSHAAARRGRHPFDLCSPESAILSAVIFNALVIIALVPLALRGVRYRRASAAALLRRNVFIYGVGGIIAPFVGIKLIDLLLSALGGEVMTVTRDLVRSLVVFARPDRDLRPRLPGGSLGRRAGAFSDAADGSLIRADGRVVGSARLGQAFASDAYFQPRPSAVDYSSVPAGEDPSLGASGGSNLGPNAQELADTVAGAAAAAAATGGRRARRGAGRPRDGVRVRRRPGHLRRPARGCRSARRPRAGARSPAAVEALVDDHVLDKPASASSEASA